MTDKMFSRTEMLLGEEKFKLLQNKCVAVIGLGGVGGISAECLVRSGINRLIVVDGDTVDISNLNRQILYDFSDIGKLKSECALKRLKSINPNIEIKTFPIFISSNNISDIFKENVDFVIDAIDDMDAKIALIKFCSNHNIPIVCSLGMGNRLDSTKVKIIPLNKTFNCPLAKKLRYNLKQEGIDLKNVICAFSDEEPLRKQGAPSSIMMVPSSAGLALAGYVIKQLTGGE